MVMELYDGLCNDVVCYLNFILINTEIMRLNMSDILKQNLKNEHDYDF